MLVICCKERCGDRSKPKPSLTQYCTHLLRSSAPDPVVQDPDIFKKMTAVISLNVEKQLAAYFQELRLDEALYNAQVRRHNEEAGLLRGANGNVKEEALELTNIIPERRK